MPHIQHLLKAGILKKCWSSWNTPLLPVKKPREQTFRPFQDLREVNKWVSDIHPTVLNPNTLLSICHQTMSAYNFRLERCLLQLAFGPQSQEIFAFEWADEDWPNAMGWLTWTRLPQGFPKTRLPQGFKNSLSHRDSNSPTLFNEALSKISVSTQQPPGRSCCSM